MLSDTALSKWCLSFRNFFLRALLALHLAGISGGPLLRTCRTCTSALAGLRLAVIELHAAVRELDR